MPRGGTIEKSGTLARQLLALDLRKAGWSYRAIADQLNVSHVQIYRDIQSELKRLAALNLNAADELRQLELERLDHIIANMDNWLRSGNTQAAMVLLKAIDSRAKLLGLYAPEQHQFITWEDQAIEDIKAGRVIYEDMVNAFDESTAARLFAAAGVSISLK